MIQITDIIDFNNTISISDIINTLVLLVALYSIRQSKEVMKEQILQRNLSVRPELVIRQSNSTLKINNVGNGVAKGISVDMKLYSSNIDEILMIKNNTFDLEGIKIQRVFSSVYYNLIKSDEDISLDTDIIEKISCILRTPAGCRERKVVIKISITYSDILNNKFTKEEFLAMSFSNKYIVNKDKIDLYF